MATRSERLLRVLSEFERVIVVTHDYPDPDAIAAGWGIVQLVRERLARECRLVGGGDIVRAENRELVRLLSPPIELLPELEVGANTATVLVDCGPSARNHLLARLDVTPTAHVDHHVSSKARKPRLAFTDLRPKVAATATIAASYLREQDLLPSRPLATAMVYALRTETLGYETHHTRLDRDILAWLTHRADPSVIAQIENAPLPMAHFSDLVLALQGTFVYDDAALCLLPRAEGPETVGEVADLLVRCEGVGRVLCGALVGDAVVLSVRTAPGTGDAAQLAAATLEGIGESGGHEHRAGGKVRDVEGKGERIGTELQDQLRSRWLAACGVERRRGTRLVPKREIVGNL